MAFRADAAADPASENAELIAMGLILTCVVAVIAVAFLPDKYRPLGSSRNHDGYPVRIEITDSGVESSPTWSLFGLSFDWGTQTERTPPDADAPVLEEETDAAALAAPGGQTEAPPPVGGQGAARVAAGLGAPIPLGGGAQMFRLDFDLAGGAETASGIRLRKEVRLDQQVLGSLDMVVDDNSAIYVSRDQIVALVPEPPPAVGRFEEEYILLADLRTAGVDLRYDATADRLILRR